MTPADVTHLLWLKEQLGAECVDVVVLNTGPEAYRRPDGSPSSPSPSSDPDGSELGR